MSLYPSITVDPNTAAASPTFVPAGQMILIPLDMTSVMMTQISLAQLSLTQDFALRAWVSPFPEGISVVAAPSNVFPVMRTGGLPITVYVSPENPPTGTLPIEVIPGFYYLNILNLTNATTAFSFSKTDLA